MRDLIRKHPGFFLVTILSGVALRLLFIAKFPAITPDSLFYGDVAKNWLRHGIYGTTVSLGISPTYIRLPGYPGFLALIFTVFGMEHYRTVLLAQLLVDLGTCFLIADLARRLIGTRAAKVAFLLSALCPFLANYTAAALTETLEIFFTALALNLAVIGFESLKEKRYAPWIGCGLASGAAILLRPDGGILLVAIEIYFVYVLLKQIFSHKPCAQVLRAGIIVGIVSVAPLAPWAVRNLCVFHEFQPLAPRYANEKNEFVPSGFHRWVKTWIVDYVSVEEVYWSVPGDKVDPGTLPARAFDSEQQRQKTMELLENYNQGHLVTPTLDAQFSALAEQRIHDKPLQYHLWLPLARIADMWLRPRAELLPADTRWWEFDDDLKWSVLTVALGMVNLLYLAAALCGLLRNWALPGLGLLLMFVFLRSAFLGTLENPEPRYMLECYPVVILLAAGLFQKALSQRRIRHAEAGAHVLGD